MPAVCMPSQFPFDIKRNWYEKNTPNEEDAIIFFCCRLFKMQMLKHLTGFQTEMFAITSAASKLLDAK